MLKDVFIRFRTMQGYQTPYVPGWDCHGLPIEHKIQQELGPKIREMRRVEVREQCYAVRRASTSTSRASSSSGWGSSATGTTRT